MSLVLSTDDMRHVLRAMPRDARALMTSRAKRGIPGRIFLAGGAIRAIIAGEPVNDWDFLGESPLAVEDFVRSLKAARSGIPARIHVTRNAQTLLTLGHSAVQGITRWCYAEPERLLAEFDFTIAQAVIWREADAWRSACADTFYADLAAKRLVYTEPKREEDAGGSMLRVMRFVRRGYSISPEQLAKVMSRLLARYEPGSGQPMDLVIAGLLREVDPLAKIDGLDLDDGETDPLAAAIPAEADL